MTTVKKQRNSFLITLTMLIGAVLVWFAIAGDLSRGWTLGSKLLTSLSIQLMDGLTGDRR